MNCKRKLGALALLAGISMAPAMAASNLLVFDHGIGVIPVSSGPGPGSSAETVNRNIVRGVQPPGNIWVIRELRASVKDDARIRVDGRGLLLGEHRQAERVPAGVGPGHDLFTLVVVAEDEQPVAEGGLGRSDALGELLGGGVDISIRERGLQTKHWVGTSCTDRRSAPVEDLRYVTGGGSLVATPRGCRSRRLMYAGCQADSVSITLHPDAAIPIFCAGRPCLPSGPRRRGR